ncbi:MAG: hypothetical protein ABF289_01260 [Clostridiales bacterium]
MDKKFTLTYNPLYFLGSLGNGGLAVTFFMYLMFMIKHPDTPIPIFDNVYKVLIGSNKLNTFLTSVALIGILYFAYRLFKTLIWNLRGFYEYKKTEAYIKLKDSNAEVTLLAVPLTLAMTVNVIFILGAVFVPGLWNYVEFLFPFAVAAFMAIGIYALVIFSEYFSRLIIKGNFDFIQNNNLSQLLASFAFIMVGVGLAGPGAMSHNLATSVVAIFGSILFSTISASLLFIKMVLGFKSIFKQGISKENAPTLWIIIPIITLFGITFVRITAGIFHNILHSNPPPVLMFFVLSVFISIQAIIGLIGYVVLNKTNYFKEYVHGEKNSIGSFSLICPGVAVFVLGMFFIHWGLVKTNIITIFSPGYFILIAPLLLIQIKTIHILSKLNKKLFCTSKNCFEKRKSNLSPIKS